MRTKVTLLLIFLNVVLVYFIFYVGGGGTVESDANLVLGPEAAEPSALTLTTANAEIKIEHRDDRWVITQPIAWTANEFAVKYILNELRALRAENTFAVEDLPKSGQTLADYGLEKPAITLTITPERKAGPAVVPLALRIGDATKQGNRLYILSTDGKRIHVVNRSLAERLGLSVSELRSEILFNIPVFEAQALTVETPPAQRTHFRRDGERWNIETLQSRASRVDTELAISGLTALHLQSFYAPGLTDEIRAAFTTPTLRITLEGNRRRETLLIGPSAPANANATKVDAATAYLARMEDDSARGDTLFVVNVPDALLNTLRRSQRDLREKHLLEFSGPEVSTLSIKSQDEGSVLLQKLDRATSAEKSLWQLSTRVGENAPTSLPADTATVETLLKDLNRLAALEFANDAPSQSERESYGFTKPAREITFTVPARPDGVPAQTTTLLIGVGTDHKTYATLANREPVYLISDEFLVQVPARPIDYRQRIVRELPTGAQITALRVTDLSNGKVIADSPIPPAAENKLPALVATLRSVRAQKFLSDHFSEIGYDGVPEHPWRFKVDATLELEGGTSKQTETYTLFFSERTGGGFQIGGSPGQDVTFQVEPVLLDALFAITYGDRDPGPHKPAETP